MKTLQQLIENSNLFKTTPNSDLRLLTITTVDAFNVEKIITIGYFDISKQKITVHKIQQILKNLVKEELLKLISDIHALDITRPNFKSPELYDFGKLVKSIGKITIENRESREAIKYLVTEHNERVKKKKIYNKESEYVIALFNKIDSLIQEKYSDKYLELLEIDSGNYQYSGLYKNKNAKHEFVYSKIKDLINCKNIATKFTITKHLDGYMWGKFCKDITLTKIGKLEWTGQDISPNNSNAGVAGTEIHDQSL